MRAQHTSVFLAALCAALAVASIVRAQASDDAAAEAARLNDAGLEAFNAGAHEDAIARFIRARALRPHEPVLRQNLVNAHLAYGAALLAAEREAAAIRQMGLALELDADNASALVSLANIYFERGDYAKAEGILEQYVDRHPEDGDAYGMLGELYYRTGELGEAVRAWQAALAANPDAPHMRERLDKAERELAIERTFEEDRDRFFSVRYQGDQLEDASYHVLRLCRDARREVGRELHVYPQRRTEVLLYTTDQFDNATQLQSHVAGLYDGKIRLRIPPGRADPAYLKRVVYHEYAHLAIGELTRDNCPYWLNEGLAQWLSERFTDAHRRGLRDRDLPPLASLEHVDIAAASAENLVLMNTVAFALVDYLRDRYSSRYLLNLLAALGEGATGPDAVQESYRRSYASLDQSLAAHIGQ